MRRLFSLVVASSAMAQAPPPPPAIATLAASASAAREANRLDEATRLYRTAVAKAPHWAEGWWYLGTMAYDQDRYLECRDAFRRFIAIEKRMAPAYAMLGLCEFPAKEYKAAVAHLERARTIGLPNGQPLTTVALYHEVLLQNHFSNFEQALRIANILSRTTAVSPEIITAAGIAAVRKPVFPSEVPESARDLVFRLGSALLPGGENPVEESLKRFEQIIKDYPDVPQVHYAFAAFLLAVDPDRGVAELKRELDISPDHIPALVSLAVEYQKRGEPESARPYAERAVKFAPANFAARGALGRILLDMGDVAGAIRELENAVRLEPNSPPMRFSLASAYSRAGRKEDASRQRAEFTRLKNLAETGASREIHP